MARTPAGPAENPASDGEEDTAAVAHEELQRYFLDSLGSAQRLDYGTGHELAFIGFLLVCEDLGFWEKCDAEHQRHVVLLLFRSYLHLVRKLQLTYRLEPAGSHGVWGLDDHQFLPYLLGSAQLQGSAPAARPFFGAAPAPFMHFHLSCVAFF